MKRTCPLVIVLLLAWISALTTASLGEEALVYTPDSAGTVSVNVIFKETVGDREQVFLENEGVRVSRVFRFIPVANIKVQHDRLSALLESLRADPRVRLVEPDGVDHVSEQTMPWGVARVGAPAVQARGDKGAGVKVAVEDTGINYNHPDLEANYRGGVDIITGDGDPMDEDGHGTHVAGTIAAVDNDQGVIGVAPQAWIYAVRVLGTGGGSHSQFAAGLQWCVDNGMQVVNYSAGGSDSETKRLACQAAYDAGILIVAAAGNDNSVLIYPARYETCLAVGAIDATDTRAWFSNYGPELDVVAPGVDVLSTTMDFGYAAWQGTSMATPHVTGVAALLIKRGISGPAALMERMRETADDLGAPGFDDYYGYGLVDAEKAVAFPRLTPVYNLLLQ